MKKCLLDLDQKNCNNNKSGKYTFYLSYSFIVLQFLLLVAELNMCPPNNEMSSPADESESVAADEKNMMQSDPLKQLEEVLSLLNHPPDSAGPRSSGKNLNWTVGNHPDPSGLNELRAEVEESLRQTRELRNQCDELLKTVLKSQETAINDRFKTFKEDFVKLEGKFNQRVDQLDERVKKLEKKSLLGRLGSALSGCTRRLNCLRGCGTSSSKSDN